MFPLSPCLTFKPSLKVVASLKLEFLSQESASVPSHELYLSK